MTCNSTKFISNVVSEVSIKSLYNLNYDYTEHVHIKNAWYK